MRNENGMTSKQTDVFKSQTFDGYEVTIIVQLSNPFARVYVHGARLNNGFVVTSKEVAFNVLRNCSVYTALEMGRLLMN